jgi:hypothetical protein
MDNTPAHNHIPECGMLLDSQAPLKVEPLRWHNQLHSALKPHRQEFLWVSMEHQESEY